MLADAFLTDDSLLSESILLNVCCTCIAIRFVLGRHQRLQGLKAQT